MAKHNFPQYDGQYYAGNKRTTTTVYVTDVSRAFVSKLTKIPPSDNNEWYSITLSGASSLSSAKAQGQQLAQGKLRVYAYILEANGSKFVAVSLTPKRL